MTYLDEIALQQPIYQVSQLNAEAKQLLENSFARIFVLGEISNLVTPSSGHLYFTLKDPRANVRCALFKHSSRRLNFTPTNGQQVLVEAQLTLYEARGDFQLVIQHMQLAGDGALQLAFLQLKQKLAALGLFETIHKKALPRFPERIGVITSATGAAIRDIIHVIQRRCPITHIIIYPSLVQGELAAPSIANAIATANRRNECDVLLLARGGGSLEDLWAFNEEIVAHAIFASQLPIISAIGHETDFTIADFVADLRAPTPSAAAEMVSPDFSEWLKQFSTLYRRLTQQQQRQLQQITLKLTTLQQRLRDPKQQLAEQAKRLTYLQQQLFFVTQQNLNYKMSQVQQRNAELLQHNPKYLLENLKNKLNKFGERAIHLNQQQLESRNQQLAHLAAQLNTVSPLQTLERGYAIATSLRDHTILRDKKQVNVNDQILVQIAHGKLVCQIQEID